jgi:ADP-ribosylglycohydrolase
MKAVSNAPVTHTTADRVRGCLMGIATGDAIGKQTEMLTLDGIRKRYPSGVRGFEGSPGEVIPRYAGNSKHEWRIGETTDDTERTIAVARAIIRDRRVGHESVGHEMLGCTKCVHPGVASLWEFHQAGDAARIATRHDGCGAAIRIAPVGIVHRVDALDALVDAAREASISTHGGAQAIAAAAATAAAVSAAIDGASSAQIVEVAERAAAMAETRWPRGTPAMARAIRDVYDGLASMSALEAAGIAARWFPDRPLTIVPLALGLATVMHSAQDAILLATNIGGDSDSVASIAGGVLGARDPNTVPQPWCEVVEEINRHNLGALSDELARLRP